MKERRTIYYTDEKNDEFSGTQVGNPRKIDENYPYLPTSFWKKFTHIFWYRVIALPIAFLYVKVRHHQKAVGRKVLKPYRKTGVFLFGNHTQQIGDAYIPSLLTFPQDAYKVANADNVSFPVIRHLATSLGILPLPDTPGAAKKFFRALGARIGEGKAVVIYPEAHIWPYYTKIRPFSDESFRFPIRLGTPVFCFTNTYQKRLVGSRPRIVTYVDGPFFPDPSLSGREQTKELRDRVYAVMTERSKLSTAEYIRYEKKENEERKEGSS